MFATPWWARPVPLFPCGSQRKIGRKTGDGRQDDDQQEACVTRFTSMPQLLAKALKSAPQIALNRAHASLCDVKGSDAQARGCVVKGTVVVSKASEKPAVEAGLFYATHVHLL